MIESRRNNRRDKLKLANNLKFKFRYTDLQASIGLIQLSNLEKFNNVRIKNAKFLMDHLSIEGVHIPKISKQSKPIFLRFPLWFENITKEKRDNLIRELRESGIDAPVAYPNSLPKFFLSLDGFPNTEEVIIKTITLPVHPYVKENDLEKAVSIIKKFIGA
jgi:dTDP-4-amino-4,6-dideoxygalactose transaminase